MYSVYNVKTHFIHLSVSEEEFSQIGQYLIFRVSHERNKMNVDHATVFFYEHRGIFLLATTLEVGYTMYLPRLDKFHFCKRQSEKWYKACETKTMSGALCKYTAEIDDPINITLFKECFSTRQEELMVCGRLNLCMYTHIEDYKKNKHVRHEIFSPTTQEKLAHERFDSMVSEDPDPQVAHVYLHGAVFDIIHRHIEHPLLIETIVASKKNPNKNLRCYYYIEGTGGPKRKREKRNKFIEDYVNKKKKEYTSTRTKKPTKKRITAWEIEAEDEADELQL